LKASPKIIRLTAMLHIRFPLSLRNLTDPLHERGDEICHETSHYWRKRFGLMSATENLGRRIQDMKSNHGPSHLDEMLVKINDRGHRPVQSQSIIDQTGFDLEIGETMLLAKGIEKVGSQAVPIPHSVLARTASQSSEKLLLKPFVPKLSFGRNTSKACPPVKRNW
jgi:putative transposase